MHNTNIINNNLQYNSKHLALCIECNQDLLIIDNDC